MTPLPAAYAWLDALPLMQKPLIIVEARALYGLHEGVGAADNPVILGWAKEVGLEKVYKHDDLAWCGLFAAVVVKRAGKEPVADPLWALNWVNFGNPSTMPGLGDVMVFKRFDAKGKLIGGHVGFYIGEDETAYHVLGGNTRDDVSIARIAKGRFAGARRPIWKIAQPDGVKPHLLAPTGALSTNEA